MPPNVFRNTPASLVASVPAMLGFVTTRSIVLIFATRENHGQGPISLPFMVRADSPLNKGSITDAELAHYAMDMCLRLDAEAVIAVIVDDRLTRSTAPDSIDARYLPVLHTLERHLESIHRRLCGIWATRALTPKADWWNPLDPTHHGHLPDPATTPLALALTSAGGTIHRSRAELSDLVAVDPALRDRVTALLPAAVADASRRRIRFARIGNPDADTRQTLWRVMHAIATCAPHETPAPAVLVEVAVALRDSTIRDVLFGVAAGVYAAHAEWLWSVLTRALPDPDRAEAATLLGFHAYLRGEAVLAGVAFEAALTSDPQHRMAQLLDFGRHHGMPPRRLHRLCDSAIADAAALRIDIGAPQPHSHSTKG
ncbi:DUF4192 domain-containing protein [Nocardia tengchongensis]|uniref:DUF4192 domain-containing protein n=1 Tax=Nocardia tengchongensis TaxID=2055889 RepID=UPI0036D1F414